MHAGRRPRANPPSWCDHRDAAAEDQRSPRPRPTRRSASASPRAAAGAAAAAARAPAGRSAMWAKNIPPTQTTTPSRCSQRAMFIWRKMLRETHDCSAPPSRPAADARSAAPTICRPRARQPIVETRRRVPHLSSVCRHRPLPRYRSRPARPTTSTAPSSASSPTCRRRARMRSPTPIARPTSSPRRRRAVRAVLSGSLALPPGPFGMLTVLPDLYLIWKTQRQMVADIFALYGRTAELTRMHMLYCLFRHAASQVLRDVAVRTGPAHRRAAAVRRRAEDDRRQGRRDGEQARRRQRREPLGADRRRRRRGRVRVLGHAAGRDAPRGGCSPILRSTRRLREDT